MIPGPQEYTRNCGLPEAFEEGLVVRDDDRAMLRG